jgi:hypothetical protein
MATKRFGKMLLEQQADILLTFDKPIRHFCT